MSQQQQGQQKEIPLSSLQPKQLLAVKKNIEDEIQALNQSMNHFKIAISKYEETKAIVNSLSGSTTDQELLVPITSSLFIPGKLENKDKVLIDFGTGFYVERNLQQAQEYSDRKLALLKQNATKLNDIVAQKANFMDKINLEIQKKVAQASQEAKQQMQQQKA